MLEHEINKTAFGSWRTERVVLDYHLDARHCAHRSRAVVSFCALRAATYDPLVEVNEKETILCAHLLTAELLILRTDRGWKPGT